MKSQESQKKKFRQLSDQELEKVTGGVRLPGATGGCDITKCFDLGKKTDSKTCECI